MSCVSRSTSKSRNTSSEKFLERSSPDDSRSFTSKFRMTTINPTSRRASAVHLGTTNTRPRSLRAKRHSVYIPHSLSGTHLPSQSPRSSIAHSLSVPDGDRDDFHLVRNFSVTSKGVVNRGDSFRCRSGSECTLPRSEEAFPPFPKEVPSTSTAGPSIKQSADISRYTVWLMGSNGVGKTSIRNQFMTSEYICQYDSCQDEVHNKSVVVSLDDVESELEIVECTSLDDKVHPKELTPDAYVIVYSVTNRRSYIEAKQILSRLERLFVSKAAILVGNKNDLARLRTVTTLEGRSLAKERGVKFIETSVAINHQVDELLVGIVTQIRIKTRAAEKQKSSQSKATCIIKRLWKSTCVTSKSCDNLHAL